MGPDPNSGSSSSDQPLSQGQRLKLAVKDYGFTVIVFHAGISLLSLGGFYTAVSRYLLWGLLVVIVN